MTSLTSRIILPCLVLAALLAQADRGLCQLLQREICAEDFVAWAKERAIPVETLDWRKFDLAKLSFMDEALEGKRIVMLGEPDHYVSEKNDVQLIMIRCLLDRGWRALGVEGMGPFLALQTDQRFAKADAATPRTSPPREDRKDVHAPLRDDAEFARLTARETSRFWRNLHELARTQARGAGRLEVIGYDVDHSPWTGYAIIDAIVANGKESPVKNELGRRLARVAGESVLEEADRLDRIERWLGEKHAALTIALGAAELRRLSMYVWSMAESYRFHHAVRNRDDVDWPAALRRRELTMARRMSRLLRSLPRDRRIILTGHNFHMGKDTLAMAGGPAPTWRSIGTNLTEALPGETFSVWMLCERGRTLSVSGKNLVRRLSSRPRSIEHLLGKVGSRFVLPLNSGDPRERYLADYRPVHFNGRPRGVVLERNADAIFFVRDVTPAGTRG